MDAVNPETALTQAGAVVVEYRPRPRPDQPAQEKPKVPARRTQRKGKGDKTDPREFTETAMARRFAAANAGKMAFDHSDGGWFLWTGSCWQRDHVAVAMEHVKTFVETEASRVEDPKQGMFLGQGRYVKSVEALARSDGHVAVHGGMWDTNPMVLGTPEGVVDLKTGTMREGRPDEYISKSTLVAPAAPGTAAPLWMEFLNQATLRDEEMKGFLHRWAGYCFTGDVSEEVLTFLYGDGGNGKGVFAGVLAKILGSYAVAMPIEAFAGGGRTNMEYYRAQMAGARLVTASETESGRHWSENQIKELTGNETEVSARQPHGRVFNYMPQSKLMFIGNHAPSLKGTSPAMERRLRIVPFDNKPQKKNLKLKEALVAEYPAILRWAIDGCLEWQKKGLGTAQVIQAASSAYFANQDVFGRWIEERCVTGDTLQTPPGKLFADYRDWARENGETALTNPEFAEKIDRTQGLKRVKVDGNRAVRGIGFKAPPKTRQNGESGTDLFG